MDKISAIAKKELRSFFYSPVAYIIITVFLIILGGFSFWTYFQDGVLSYSKIFSTISIIYIFMIPIISMRAFAEEKKSGTIELLLTKPITDMQLTLGKFFSLVLLNIIALIPTVIYFVVLSTFGKLDFGAIFTSYLGIILLACLYISICLFFSSITQHQIVAGIMSFPVIAFLFLLYYFLPLIPAKLAGVLSYIAPNFHLESFSKGVIDTGSLIYFISGIVIFILLTRTSLESRKWQ